MNSKVGQETNIHGGISRQVSGSFDILLMMGRSITLFL